MQAIPLSIFSWNFEILDGRKRVCQINQAIFRERAFGPVKQLLLFWTW